MRIRDQRIIELVHRYVIVTVSLLHREFFPGLSVNAVSQVTSRLVKQRLLASQQLFGNDRCYRIGPAAVQSRASVEKSQTKRLPVSRMSVEFAALQFCLGNPVRKRHRLTPVELVELYPTYPKTLRWKHPYCLIEQDGVERLAMIRVELSSTADAIVHKHLKSFYRYREDKGFAGLIKRKQFVLVVISPLEHVLRGLAEEIPQHRFYPTSHLFYCEELKKFLPQGACHA